MNAPHHHIFYQYVTSNGVIGVYSSADVQCDVITLQCGVPDLYPGWIIPRETTRNHPYGQNPTDGFSP